MDVLTLTIIGTVIVLSLYAKMIWVAVIAGIIFVMYIYGMSAVNEPVAVPTGAPKIRPIIVQRRYTGPESIYPMHMRIRLQPMWNTRPWVENASFGLAQGMSGIMGLLGIHRPEPSGLASYREKPW